MKADLWVYYAALGAGMFLTAISHVLLRYGAVRGRRWWHGFLNIQSAIGYMLFVVVTLLVVFACQGLPLHKVMAWNSATFFLTPLAGALFLREKITGRALVGWGLILGGIVIFSLA